MLATQRLNALAQRVVFPARSLPAHALLTDLHLHTDYTDGRSSIDDMLAAATQAGLAVVGFTEHVRLGTPWFEDFKLAVAHDASAYPGLEVLTGIEAKALDYAGSLDADPEVIAQADVVLGAFHDYPDGRGGFVRRTTLSADAAARMEFEALWALLDHPEVDVLAHPGAITRKLVGSFPDSYLRRLIKKAAASGRAVEINGEYNSDDELALLLEWCSQEGAWITLGSNAHHGTEVARVARRLMQVHARAH